MVTELLQRSVERVGSSFGSADASVFSRLNAQNPWPGLAAYDEASQDFFNGRSEEAAELLRLIRLAPLTVLYGKSGLGKSSLLQAGLFPLLRAGHYLPVNLILDYSEGTAVFERVAQRLMEELYRSKAEFPARGDDEGLWEYLHRKDLDIWTADNFPLTPVLVFDQFEELFSRSGGNSEMIRQIIHGLGDLIENRMPAELSGETARPKRSKVDEESQRYRIVLSFREDFLAQVRTWEEEVPSLRRNYLRLEPMTRQRAIEAVERSGSEVLDEGVAPIIVDFVGRVDEGANESDRAKPVIEPVLLSLCCYQLNRRRDGKRIDKALVDRAGRDILDSFYREALDDEEVRGPPDVSEFIEDFLIQGERFRGNYPRKEALSEERLTQRQLAALTDRHRLLRVVSHADTERIELIHDRLVPVVRKARDERRAREHQDEQERKAKQAQAELEQERAQRKRERRKFFIASAAAIVIFATAIVVFWLSFYTWRLQQNMLVQQNALSQEQKKTLLQQQIMIAKQLTSLGAQGGSAFKAGTGREDQAAYRGLVAYRLATKATKSSPKDNTVASASTAHSAMEDIARTTLSALHPAMEDFAYLRKIVRLRDAAPTPALAYSPDGHALAAGGTDGSIHLIDAETYREQPPLKCPHPSGTAVWSIAFNVDGRRLVAGFARLDGDQDKPHGVICVFDVANRSVLQTWAAADVDGKSSDIGDILSVDYSRGHGKEFVAAGGSDNLVFVGDVESGGLRSLPKRGKGNIAAISVSASGRKIAAAGKDKIIRVWDLGAQNKEPVELKGHRLELQTVMFLPGNDSIVVSVGDDGYIKVWNVRQGWCETRSTSLETRIYALDIRRDVKMVAAAGEDGKVRLFWLDEDLSCKIERSGQKARPGPIHGGASPRGRQSSRNRGNRRASGTTDRKTPELNEVKDGVWSGHNGLVMAVAFNREGDRLASTGTDGSVRIWGPKTDGFSLAELQSKSDDGEATPLPANVTTVVISPDGTSIAAGDVEGNIHLWDRQKEYTEPQLQPATKRWRAHPNAAVRSLAYIRIGNSLALVSGGDDGVLKSWDAESGNNIPGDMADNAGPVRAIAVSPDGTMLAAGSSDGTVRIWNPATRAPPRRIDRPKSWETEYELHAVGFSPDAKYLMIGSGRLWRIPLGGADREPAAEDDTPVGHTDEIRSVSQLHTGDGGRVLSAGKDGTVLVWKLEGAGKSKRANDIYPQEAFEYRMKTRDGNPLTAMDVSADGRLILTGGEWGQVQLWDAVNRELIAPRIKAHDEDIEAVALAPDGSFFVTAEAKKILLWPGPVRWADMICQKLSWNMSDQQWNEWILESLKSDLKYEEQCTGLPKLED